jgi:cell fate regulator YaaT (PSP1 superfamily)
MRQVGPRDETKMRGGIGPCGLTLCCSTFLKSFHPVTIKMAKNQNLSLNPSKISGMCGRLMCCLAYEEESYRTAGPPAPAREGGVKAQNFQGDAPV